MPTRQSGGKCLGQFKGIHRLDQGEFPDDLIDLIGLELADEVPLDISGKSVDLRYGFLDAVLSEKTESQVISLPDGLGREGFGDGQKDDGIRSPPGTHRRLGDTLPDLKKPGLKFQWNPCPT